MPDLLGWARGLGRAALLNTAIGQTAALVADYFDRHGIGPQELEFAIAAGRPLLREALAEASAAEIAAVRGAFGGIADDFRRSHRAPDGTSWHPYKAVLQEEVLGVGHAEHVAVLERHQQWYRQQMDAAVTWLFGPPSGTPPAFRG